MPYSRRRFLQTAAVLIAASLLPRAPRLLAADTEPANAVDAYLTAMETPYDAPLNDHFLRVIGNGNVGLLLFDVNTPRLITALNPENPLPVASAFKGPLLMYFLDVVDPAVWSTVPVSAWGAVAASEVPEDARTDWERHNPILRSLYQTIVFSDNFTTGAVLSYAAAAQNRGDAVVAFNDWARDTVGMSQLSGLSAWRDGVAADMTHADERYLGRGTTVAGQVFTYDNMMTPRDLGLFYMWMLTHADADAQRVANNLLSTVHNDRGANLERLAMAHEGKSYSKNGSLDTDGGYVVTDAGLIDLPGGELYLLVLVSLGAPTVIPTVFEELSSTLNGKYNEAFHNRHHRAITNEELLATYREHLQVAYTEQSDRVNGLYRYGFIMPEGVNVYLEPDEDAKLHNPIIKSTRFGVHLLMQGALVRYVEHNRRWVELMPDNDFDNVRSRLGVRTFVKKEDVWPISLDYAAPINYLNDPDATPQDKLIIIDLVARELWAIEGDVPVMRVPIVLNPDFTPRGVQVITSKWLARSMQPWAPGVPFTAFFGSEGYALHGSPWQRWSTTVNRSTITGRSSAGCVNIPDWLVKVGEYTRPADEMLFRWVGGIENPRENVFEYPTDNHPAMRIYNVDYLHHLYDYILPEAVSKRGTSWEALIARMEEKPLQAPASFFVE